ncbi:MAG TPA: type I restriction-modification enzyme R subunit C-terminal domain-containing protein, partial [Microthrixaceae bacterium]|nr:type I restriction-modification enzyme R subunit C-terminal domain-containing protein [Microthrixaceae bacterium]
IQRQVRAIASILEDHSRIPAIAAELALIHDLQTDEWWTDVTLQMIETTRRRLRPLVPLIEKRRRAPLYTNFSDDIGEGVEVDLGIGGTDDFAQFRSKATAFMREHNDHLAIQRLRRNQPITESDLTELARMLFEVRGGSEVNVQRASVETGGLGLFVRSLVGMDRSAAKDAFAGFLDERVYSGNQIEYVNLVIDHLANDGVVEPRRFYESPYTDVAPAGPDGVFSRADVERFIGVVHEIRATATAETG